MPSSLTQPATPVDESFYISHFDPPSGTVAALPVTVNVTFSESELDPLTVNSLTHFNTVCNGISYAADAVVYSSGSIITAVNLPSITGLSSGTVCHFVASSNITTSAGVHLTGTRFVTYTIQ